VRDVGAVTGALRQMLDDRRRGAIETDPGVRQEVIRRFSRQKLAGQLAEVLRATIEDGPPGAPRPRAEPNGRSASSPDPQTSLSLASA
jgi:hypothetical protein